MTNQETNVSNAAESTLSSDLALAATTVNVTSTADFPAPNFYVVIDPDDDAKREVVLATAKTGTTLTIERGMDGTADVAHDTNAIIAVVPVAAHFTDINDRVEAHTHSGGTDGADVSANVDHGSLAGLADFTTDHGTEHDAHDHSAAAATIASADLADHNKAVHDALNIDADTLDGLDSTAFAAVAGDTFTGAVTFGALLTAEAGVEGSLGTDVKTAANAHSDWPSGLSWQRVTTGAWPTTTGMVATFNFGNDPRTWQLFFDSSSTATMYFRRLATATTWASWQTVTTAENPGLWEVDNSTQVATASVSGSTLTAIASVTLSIPSDWNSWRCESYATFTARSSSDNNYNAAISIDGTDQQTLASVFLHLSRRFAGSVSGRRTGMTTTGSRTVALKASEGLTAGVDFDDIHLYARAVRTS